MSELTLSERQLDYMREMMNIGTGNAAAALSGLLHLAVDTRTPEIHICPLREIATVLGQPAGEVAGIKLDMTGDLQGYLFFIVPESHRRRFVELARRPMTGKKAEEDSPVMKEVADVVVGSHLKAIREFCGLNILHSAPAFAVDMVQALLDESIARVVSQKPLAVLIQSIFLLTGERISTFLVMVLAQESIPRLVDSIEQARKKLGRAQH